VTSGAAYGGAEGGSGCGVGDLAATLSASSSASCLAKASSSIGCINGDDILLVGRDAERWGVWGEEWGLCEETGDSDTGTVKENEGDFEGPASVLGTGMPKYDACLNDSSIAFARSSSSLETFTECSIDSLSERASTRASSSSSLTGVFLVSSSNLGGGPVGIRGGDEARGGGWANKGGATVSYGES